MAASGTMSWRIASGFASEAPVELLTVVVLVVGNLLAVLRRSLRGEPGSSRSKTNYARPSRYRRELCSSRYRQRLSHGRFISGTTSSLALRSRTNPPGEIFTLHQPPPQKCTSCRKACCASVLADTSCRLHGYFLGQPEVCSHGIEPRRRRKMSQVVIE
jgi:hypothetical protein